MAYLDNFHTVVGETIMECQRIEHDIKLIYAGMLEGDIDLNYREIKYKPLGNVLIDLVALDNSDGKPYLTEEDYGLLMQIKNVRNWLVHKSYSDFMYCDGDRWKQQLDRSYSKLKEFNARIKILGEQVEKIRFDVLKKYGRI